MSLTKAINTKAGSKAALRNTLDYIYRDKKVTDDLKLVTGDYFEPKVTADLVFQHFMETKELWGKTGGRMYKHFVISFHPNEPVTPEETLLFGKEWAEKCFPGYDCALASHIDTDHCHVHVVVNSVNSIDGRKLNLSNRQFQKMKDINDELCRAHGLSVCVKGKHFDGTDLEEGTITSWNKKDYQNNTKKHTVKNDCITAVIAAMAAAVSREDFIDQMELAGFQVTWENNRKHIAFSHIETGQVFRDSNLAKSYTMDISKEAIGNAVDRNRTVQKERDHITREGNRDSGLLEEPVRKAVKEYKKPDADHRRPAEKDSPVGGRADGRHLREWPVTRIAREIENSDRTAFAVINWAERIRKAFDGFAARIRHSDYLNRDDSIYLKYEAKELAKDLDGYLSMITRTEFYIRYAYIPQLASRPDLAEFIERCRHDQLSDMDSYRQKMASADPLVLVLAQSMRPQIHEQELANDLDELCRDKPTQVRSAEEAVDLYRKLDKEICEKMKDVDAAIDEHCEKYHIEKPDPHPVRVRHRVR